MQRLLVKPAVMLAAILTSGCDWPPELLRVGEKLSAQEKRITEQGEQINSVQSEIEALRAEIQSLKQSQSQLELKNIFREIENIAYLSPGDDGYSTVRFDLGALTVQLSDVKPYANGSKAHLRFGNPLASSINGVKLKIEWGQMDDNGAVKSDTERGKEVSFAETFRSGAWTNVSVVLDGTPPSELGFVRVRNVSHSGISLIK
mgnify:CR=1 FL=1